MSKIFEALSARRSNYGLGKKSSLSNAEVQSLVEKAVLLTPSAFNAQTPRTVILFDDSNDTFWDITRDELRKVAPEEGFENTITKLESFKAGQGTVLFYLEESVVKGLQEQFVLYADNFPVWAQQENGMLQLVIWTALAEHGIGASLQHYNPVVDVATAAKFGISEGWKLVAQMPFGNRESDESDKDKLPVSETVLVK